MFDLKTNKISIPLLNQAIITKGNDLIKKGFGKVFYFVSKCRLNNTTHLVDYEFKLKNSPLTKKMLTLTVDENDNIITYNCNYCSSFTFCSHLYACVLMYENTIKQMSEDELNDKYNKIQNTFLELEEENKRKIYEAERKKSLDEVAYLLESIKSCDALPLSTPVHINCCFEQYEGILLYFKVGIDKMYIVQSLVKFLTAIKNKETLLYGKNFSFNHGLNNFDEKAQEIIKYVLSFYNEVQSFRSIDLNSIQLDQIFNILKGCNIQYKDVESSEANQNYFVSLDEVEIRLKLDDKYNLSIDKNKTIIFGYENDYLLENGFVYKVIYRDPSLRIMTKHLAKSKQSYETIKDVFKEKIYPRLYPYIDVDEKIKDELQIINYNINVYFDMVDGVLEYQIKYMCGDTEVDAAAMDVVSFKVNRCNNFLSNLGFNEVGRLGEMPKIVNFLRSDLTQLRQVADVFLSENIKNIQVKSNGKFSTHMSYNTNMLQICFDQSDFSDEELNKIIRSLRKKTRFIKLNKNTIIEIDEKTANKLLNTIDEFNLDITKLSQVQEIPLYQSLKLADKSLDVVDYKINDNLKKLLSEISGYKKAKFEVPSHLVEVMRSYQKDAFRWIKTLVKYGFCGILADDMGLGKSLEIISALCSDKDENPILIVCPKSLCYNWKNEFSLWGQEFEVVNIIGSVPDRIKLINNIDNKRRVVYISSYDSLRNDIDYYKDKKFKYMILDEAQSIKNYDTLKARSVKMIKSDIRFVLTGTPIENTIIDLWSIFDFLMPGYLGQQGNFKGRYEMAIVERRDATLIEHLVKKITPFVLRRTKNDVLKDLPSKVEFIRMAAMDVEQKKIYDAQLKKTKDILTSDKDNKILLLSCLTRLRQICVDPGLFVSDYNEGSCKLDLLMEIVEEYVSDGHKIVIFSQFVAAFDKIKILLTALNYKYFVLTGKTSALERVDMANEFNKEDNDVKVFLVSLKAGGTGLNLVGADVVIHLDPWWNYAVENQATDRTHRIGQTKSVSVIKLIVENSIEQKVIELQRIKKDIADRIISSDDSNINSLIVDDIKYLLE